MSRQIKTIAWACLASWIFGIGIGWWGARELFPRRWNRQERYQRMLDRFSSRLQLTPTQRGQISSILETQRKRMETLRAQLRPKMDDIQGMTREQIRALLDPDQQARFDRLEMDWQARGKRFRSEWGR